MTWGEQPVQKCRTEEQRQDGGAETNWLKKREEDESLNTLSTKRDNETQVKRIMTKTSGLWLDQRQDKGYQNKTGGIEKHEMLIISLKRNW